MQLTECYDGGYSVGPESRNCEKKGKDIPVTSDAEWKADTAAIAVDVTGTNVRTKLQNKTSTVGNEVEQIQIQILPR